MLPDCWHNSRSFLNASLPGTENPALSPCSGLQCGTAFSCSLGHPHSKILGETTRFTANDIKLRAKILRFFLSGSWVIQIPHDDGGHSLFRASSVEFAPHSSMCSCHSHKYVFRFNLTVSYISHCKKIFPPNDRIEASGSKIQSAYESLGDIGKKYSFGGFGHQRLKIIYMRTPLYEVLLQALQSSDRNSIVQMR